MLNWVLELDLQQNDIIVVNKCFIKLIKLDLEVYIHKKKIISFINSTFDMILMHDCD